MAKKDKPPAFLFYAKDWLTSETVQAMSDAQFRAYVNLLAQCWLSDPPCSVPDDDSKLAIISRIGKKKWIRASAVVKNCFEKREGRLINKKLEGMWFGLQESQKVASHRGHEGALARWGKINKTIDTQGHDDASSIHQALDKGMLADGSSSSSSKKEEILKKKGSFVSKAKDREEDEDENQEVWGPNGRMRSFDELKRSGAI